MSDGKFSTALNCLREQGKLLGLYDPDSLKPKEKGLSVLDIWKRPVKEIKVVPLPKHVQAAANKALGKGVRQEEEVFDVTPYG